MFIWINQSQNNSQSFSTHQNSISSAFYTFPLLFLPVDGRRKQMFSRWHADRNTSNGNSRRIRSDGMTSSKIIWSTAAARGFISTLIINMSRNSISTHNSNGVLSSTFRLNERQCKNSSAFASYSTVTGCKIPILFPSQSTNRKKRQRWKTEGRRNNVYPVERETISHVI